MNPKKWNENVNAAIEKFGLTKEIDLKEKDKLVLNVLSNTEMQYNFYSLCTELDVKPSKLLKRINRLVEANLLTHAEDGEIYILTDAARKYLARTKEDTKRERKFKEFIACLNEEELQEFYKLCAQFHFTEE